MYTLENVLTTAIQAGASDIHITVGRPVMYRIDGILRPTDGPILQPDDTKALGEVMYAKNERLVTELNETGETDFAYALPGKGRFRVNVFHQRGSIGMVLRLLPFEIPDPNKLGIPKEVLDLCTRKRGLVLVTGPTGSGKSTTLAAMINKVNTDYPKHIITLEDPIEYTHEHKKSVVNQRELGNDTVSYASAVRAALRQDPDVILVGEMRDLETISTALTAAETGHLVFSTLHTNSAASTIDRVIDVFPPHQQDQIRIQLGAVIEGVVAQQLLPKAGGKGRVAAMEIMFGTPAIRNLIREGKSFQIPSQIQMNRKMGMILMDDKLYELYKDGLIDRENCMEFAQDVNAMKRRIMG